MASSGNLLRTAMQNETADIHKKFIKLLDNQTSQADKTRILGELKGVIEPTDTEDTTISQFQFEAHTETLSEWQTKVATRLGRARIARPNVHWKIVNGVAYKNTNEDSWLLDEREECLIDRDLKLRNLKREDKAMPTRQELDLLAIEMESEVRQTNEMRAREAATWVPVKREECNDARQEDSLIIFMDDKHNEVDWIATIHKLKKFGNSVGYSADHFSNCLDRLVSYFMPALREVVADLTADDKARYLMNRSSQETPYHRMYEKLNNLTRMPSESIRVKLADLQAIAEATYKDKAEPEKSNNIARIMVDGMINFTTGKTKEEVLSYIEYTKSERKTIDWKKMIIGVCEAERVFGAPTVQLRFNTAVQPTQRLFNVTPTVNVQQRPMIRPVQLRGYAQTKTRKDNTLLDAQNSQDTWKTRFLEYRQKVEDLGEELGQILDLATEDQQTEEVQVDQDQAQGAASSVEEQSKSAPDTRKSARPKNKPDTYVPTFEATFDQYMIQLMQSRIERFSKDTKKDRSRNTDKKKFEKSPSQTSSRQSSNTSSRQPSNQSSNRSSRQSSRTRTPDKSKKPDSTYDKKKDYEKKDSSHKKDYRSSKDSSSKKDYSSSRDKKSYDKKGGNSRPSSGDRRIEKGVTCSVDYDPKKNKHCAKCSTFLEHHEFDCPYYLRRAVYNCSRCKKGYHWAAECRQGEQDGNRSRSRSKSRDKIKEKLN